MPEHGDRTVGVLFCRAFQVGDRQNLTGDGADKAHVEVFLPADQRIVGAAEGNADAVVRQPQRYGGKLRLRNGVRPAFKIDDLCIAEPVAFAQRAEQRRVVFLSDASIRVVSSEQGRCGIFYGGFAVQHIKGFKGQIRNARKDHTVHFVHGYGLHRQVAAPVQIVKYVRHESHLTFSSL